MLGGTREHDSVRKHLEPGVRLVNVQMQLTDTMIVLGHRKSQMQHNSVRLAVSMVASQGSQRRWWQEQCNHHVFYVLCRVTVLTCCRADLSSSTVVTHPSQTLKSTPYSSLLDDAVMVYFCSSAILKPMLPGPAAMSLAGPVDPQFRDCSRLFIYRGANPIPRACCCPRVLV